MSEMDFWFGQAVLGLIAFGGTSYIYLKGKQLLEILSKEKWDEKRKCKVLKFRRVYCQ